jgi:hypothetical protein
MLSRSEKLKLGLTYWVGAASVFGIIGWSTLTVVDMKNDLGKAEKDRAALAQQVKDLGGTPVAGPRGTTGTAGRDGRDGDPGTSGKDGANGTNGAPGTTGTNGAHGKDGVNGAAGTPGTDGRDGRDGAVGPQGPKGDQGEQGVPGTPGPLCPEGYGPDDVQWVGKTIIVCVKNESLGG